MYPTYSRENVTEGGFCARRPGLAGKMLSHILREGAWASRSRPNASLDNSFLVSTEMNLHVQSFSIRLTRSYLRSISTDLETISQPTPIQLREAALRGIVRLGAGGEGRIDILTEIENQELVFKAKYDQWQRAKFDERSDMIMEALGELLGIVATAGTGKAHEGVQLAREGQLLRSTAGFAAKDRVI